MKKLSSYVISVFLMLTTIPFALVVGLYIGHDLYLEHQKQTMRYERVIAQQLLDSRIALSQFDLLQAELVTTQVSQLDYIVSVKLESLVYGLTLAEVINKHNDDLQTHTLVYSIDNKLGETIGILTVEKDKKAFVQTTLKAIAPKLVVLTLILLTVSLAFTRTILAALNRPFLELQKFAFQIANGDYQTPSKTDSNILEITTIFSSLETMRRRLKDTIFQLEKSEEKHSRTYNLTQVCLFVINVEKNLIIRANSKFLDEFDPIPNERKRAVLEAFIQEIMKNSSTESFNYSLLIRDQKRYFQINRSNIIHGEVECSALEITELMEAKLKTESMLLTDALTHVANRHCFNTDMAKFQRLTGTELTVMILDLNGFKAINDDYGHTAGDHLLIEVAQRLNNALQNEPAKLYRLGGDEFVILLQQKYSHSHVELLIEMLLRTFDNPVHYQTQPLFVSTSIGVAHYDQSCGSISDTIHQADVAMYQAKTSELKVAYASNLLLLQHQHSTNLEAQPV
ncbi:GGDEF domain-containing protein [Vibrio sp. 404]|uniref:GGDEF domain-containing protein n=1 Tax=Vibrio marinisediminis TaxID=2758441 RepID=A0A7W2FTP1_9VIBR|nr:GGDEF domain-containing protein [Vibrio marinisediminis]MBA5764025.1 GGDEF domain-containing protein [Vibrio marinisediminis]